MPAIEAGVVAIKIFWNRRGVECLVVRMAELDIVQTLMLGDEAVANDLNLGLVRDRLKVRVQNAALGVEGLAVAVRGGGRVEATGQLELCLWRQALLVLEDNNLVRVECLLDDCKVGIYDDEDSLIVCSMADDKLQQELTRGGYRFYGFSPS